jgi:hypothetical protein
MKTILEKFNGTVNVRKLFMPILFSLISLLLSGSAFIQQQDVRINISTDDKKLTLLEKLEKGVSLSSEEIRASFGNRKEECAPEFHEFISDDDIGKMKESIIRDLGIIKREMGNLKNSDEFVKAMDEVRKVNEEIRNELEKIREEIKRSDRWTGEWENC